MKLTLKTKLFALLAIPALLLLSQACSKDKMEMFSDMGAFKGLSGVFAQISKSDGMLVFPSQQVFNQVMDEIEALDEQISDFVINQEKAGPVGEYPHLDAILNPNGPFNGLNPITGQPINLTVPQNLQLDVNDAPIKWLFEDALGFNSLRRQILADLRAVEEVGALEPFYNNPDNHFLADENLRLVMNEDLEVQIGTEVIKVISTEAAVGLESCSASLLTTIRDLYPTPYTYTGEKIGPSYEDVVSSYDITSNTCISVYPVIGVQVTPICIARPYYQGGASTNEINFWHNSAGFYNSVEWTFPGGATSTSDNPSFTFPGPGQHQVTLCLKYNGSVCDCETFTVNIGQGCNADFDLTQTPLCVMATNLSTGPNIVISRWFLDGVLVGNNINDFPLTCNLALGAHTLCLTIQDGDNGCIDTWCEPFYIHGECCMKGTDRSTDKLKLGSVNRYMVAKVWTTHISGSRGARGKTLSYRKNNAGFYVRKDVDVISAGIQGTLFEWNDVNETCDVIHVGPIPLGPATTETRTHRSSAESAKLRATRTYRIHRESVETFHYAEEAGQTRTKFMNPGGYGSGPGDHCDGD